MENLKSFYEVVVIGAGPAGSSAATFLAQLGHDVLLVEREKFPRHHIGESLMPNAYWQLKRLNVIDKLKEIGFVRKHSVQFVNDKGKASKPFYFKERNSHESSVTWQVERSEFDQMMLNNAAEHGAQIMSNTKVIDILQDNDTINGVVVKQGEHEHKINAKVVVDASGTSAFIARRLKIYEPDPHLNKGVLYTYFRGAMRECGVDEGTTIILHTEKKDGWFWYIPLKDNVVSVGVVSDIDKLFRDRTLSKCGIFMREVNRCKALKEKIQFATPIANVKVCKDFSYKSKQVAGNGYVLVGDAFSFIDPVYSSGVFLAMKSAEFAADAIHKALKADDVSAERLRSFEPQLLSGMESIKKLVYTFYDNGFSFAKFLKAYPQHQDILVDILIGDVFKDGIDEIFTAMENFQSPQMEYAQA
ncbi:NAD(P)/FAD-dependent oxidoreductase [Candidatus Uabimicrobium amorphum]|uniref:Alkylhalidase n=1 Tax=Uabimicrobium amorphum TaxID=2596890 RepID=A0A5S9IKN4_UABAM|nr:NAD(P)/FAD-dependent oxidoreductase [Candidatus Uabimicrobium amorphum]BBM82820.1 alkylhalidase [Candidatus Uabimicrobium amorphum]